MAQVATNLNRQPVTTDDITKGIIALTKKLYQRLDQKGSGAYVSRHEILGILTEEMQEVQEAIRDDSSAGYIHYNKELMDVAVGALFGYICIESGYIP